MDSSGSFLGGFFPAVLFLRRDMKKRFYTVLAYACFWLGDMVSKPMCKFDWVWLHDLYQWLMRKSDEIQHKHKLSGPWKPV